MVNKPVKITLYNSHWCISCILRNAISCVLSSIRRLNCRFNRFRSCIILNNCTTVIQNKIIFCDLIRYISLHHLCGNSPFKIRFYNSHRHCWLCRSDSSIIVRLRLILLGDILYWLHNCFWLRSCIILNNCPGIVKHEIIWTNLSCNIPSYNFCADSPLEICSYGSDRFGLGRWGNVFLCGYI